MPPRQFDVYVNPVPRARRDFPFLVIVQSEQADTGRLRLAAPLARLGGGTGTVARRLTPVMRVEGQDHVLLMHRLVTLDTTALSRPVANLDSERDAILSAVDLLIFGI